MLSETLFERAQKCLPAGVNSPVRAFRSVGGAPIFMQRGQGAYMTDVDGRRYLDFCGSWGPLILGHCHPAVQDAIRTVVEKGWTFGTPVPEEVELAELVVEKLDGLEMVRFVNSGTEAVMSAIRLARGYTGRDHVLKFSGCYHGHVDYLLVEAGSGLATFGTASSLGVPADFAKLTATMPLDDLAGLESLFRKMGGSLAAVIIEGAPANNGLLVQSQEYISKLRALCDQNQVLLIFDEVLSGFRMPEIMAYRHYHVQPDLITLGKVIGGGMPVGAYGGKREIMSLVSPLGGVYQAGTLSGNPVAMAAGFATLKTYYQIDAPTRLEATGRYLDAGMARVLNGLDQTGYIRLGSLFWLYFNAARPPRRAEDISPDGAPIYAKLHRFLLDRGVYLAPSAYEVGFLNTAMTETDLDLFLNAMEDAREGGLLS